LERLNDVIQEKTAPFEEEKSAVSSRQCTVCHKSIKTTAKLHELGYELLSHRPYSPDLALSDLFLFADLRRMLAGKKFSTNEEEIAETEIYFEAISKSDYKNGIEKLYDRYNRCIAFEGIES
jgi:[histone H3]-lysine36 N-dimethyltransferase SETMAR